MTAVLKQAPPRGRTQRLARRTAMYQERGSPVRMAVERTASINASIVEILKKTAKYPVEHAHGLLPDAE